MTQDELQAIRERVEHDRIHPYAVDYKLSTTEIIAQFADGRVEKTPRGQLERPYLVAQPKMKLSDLPKALDEIERQAKEIERLREELLHIAHCTTLSVANKWAREALEGDER